MPVVGTTPDAPVGLEVQSSVVETVVGAVLQIVPHLVRSVAILPSHEGTGVGPSLESRCRDGTVEHAIFDTILGRMAMSHDTAGVGLGGGDIH